MKKYFIHVLLCLIMAVCGVEMKGQIAVSTYSPGQGATNVALNAGLVLTFNDNIRFANSSITRYVRIFRVGDPIAISNYMIRSGGSLSANLTINGTQLTILHTLFSSDNQYYITIDNGAIESTTGGGTFTGIAAPPDVNAWQFTTLSTPPIPVNYNPPKQGGEINANQSLELTFNIPIQLGTGWVLVCDEEWNHFAVDTDFGIGSLSVKNNNTLVITPAVGGFNPNRNYFVMISPDAVMSTGGTYFSGFMSEIDWTFSIINPIEITSTNPTYGATNVPANQIITATFNKNIEFGGSEEDFIIINNSKGSTPTVFWMDTDYQGLKIINGNTIQISGITLESETTYYITISSGAIKSTNGVYFEGLTSTINSGWYFTTAPPASIPTVISLIPEDDSKDVDLIAPLKIVFSEKIVLDPVNVTGSIVILSGPGIGVGGVGRQYFRLSDYGTLLSIESTNGLTDNVLVIAHDAFTAGEKYYVTFPNPSIRSLTNGYFAGSTSDEFWNFWAKTLFTPLILSPESGEYGVPANTNTLTITFDTNVQFGTSGYVRVFEFDNDDVNSFFECQINNGTPATPNMLNIDGKTLQILINTPFVLGKKYYVQISNQAIKSTVGNHTFGGLGLSNKDDWSFTIETDIYEWEGGGTFGWNDPLNWDEHGLPQGENAIVVIKAGSPNYPVISSENIVVGNLTIEAGAKLTITGGSLDVRGLLKLKSDSVVNASFIKTGGTINIHKTEVDQVMHYGMYETYLVSSPVFGATSTNLIEAPYQIQVRYPDNAGVLQTYAGALQTGYGYSIRSTSPSFTFKGNINDNPFYNIPVNNLNPGYLWKQVGNPYPAAIEWTALVNNNLEDSFWIWIHGTSANSGSYGVYNGASGITTKGISSVIPSNHGFLVKASDANGGTVIFSKSALVANDGTYLRAPKAIPSHIKLSGVKDSNKDEIAVAFIDEAIDGVDRFDSEKYFSGSADLMELYTYSANMKSAINSLPYTENMEIPLSFSVKQAGNFSIELTADYTENGTVFLIDKDMDITTNLTEVGSYSFDVAVTGSNESRFVLKFSGEMVDVENIQTTPIKVFTDEKTIIVDVPVSKENQIEYKLVDVSGRLLNNGYLTTGARNTIDVATAGVYMLVISNKEFSGNYKVIVK